MRIQYNNTQYGMVYNKEVRQTDRKSNIVVLLAIQKLRQRFARECMEEIEMSAGYEHMYSCFANLCISTKMDTYEYMSQFN